MGAVESSTAQAVGSLTDTLQQLQAQLARVEDLALHLDQQPVDSDCVFLCGRRVRCDPRVRLLVGPVLGLARGSELPLLVEVDAAATIEAHVFAVDASGKQGVHVRSQSFEVKGNNPSVVVLRELELGQAYLCYFGGVRAEDCLAFPAMWRQSPPTRIVATSGTAGSLAVGDGAAPAWGWDSMHTELRSIAVHTVTDIPSTANEHRHPTGRDATTDSANSGNCDNTGASLFVHLGGLVDLREKLTMHCMPLLDALMQPHIPVQEWRTLLRNAETVIKAEYQAVLTAPTMRLLLRSNFCLLLPGSEESGTHLLAKNTPADALTDFARTAWHFVANSLRRKLRVQTHLYLRQLYVQKSAETEAIHQDFRALDELLVDEVRQRRLLQLQQDQLAYRIAAATELEALLGVDAAEVRKARQLCEMGKRAADEILQQVNQTTHLTHPLVKRLDGHCSSCVRAGDVGFLVLDTCWSMVSWTGAELEQSACQNLHHDSVLTTWLECSHENTLQAVVVLSSAPLIAPGKTICNRKPVPDRTTLAAVDVQLLFEKCFRWANSDAWRRVVLIAGQTGGGSSMQLQFDDNTARAGEWRPITQYCCGPLFQQMRHVQWEREVVAGNVSASSVEVQPRRHFLVIDVDSPDRQSTGFRASFRTSPESTAALVMGPVVGAVTANTAVVAAEANATQPLTCTLVNQLTNEQMERTVTAVAFRPAQFAFTGLEPGTPYQLWLSPVLEETTAVAHFCTPPLLPSAQAELLRDESAITTLNWAVSFLFIGDDCPAAQLSYLADATAHNGDLEQFVHDHAQSNLSQAAELCRQLGATLRNSPGDKAVFAVHLGVSADHGYSLRDTVAALMQSATLPTEAQWTDVESRIQDTYRLHWGTSYMRHILGAGSHRFLVNELDGHAAEVLCRQDMRHLNWLHEQKLMPRLLEIISSVQSQYMAALGYHSETASGNMFEHGPVCFCAVNAAQDDVMLEENTTDGIQWRHLRRRLTDPDVHCVVICSNIPFVATPSIFQRAQSGEVLYAQVKPGQFNSHCYEQSWGTDCPGHLAVLLELAVGWLSAGSLPHGPQRQILLVARSVSGFAFLSDITVTKQSDPVPADPSAWTFKQVVCGALAPQSLLWRHSSHVVSATAEHGTEASPIPTSGRFETRRFAFSFTHHSIFQKASCAVVEISRDGSSVDVAARFQVARADVESVLTQSVPSLQQQQLLQYAQELTSALIEDPSFPTIAPEAAAGGADCVVHADFPKLCEATKSRVAHVVQQHNFGEESMELLCGTAVALLCEQVTHSLDQLFYQLHSGRYGDFMTKPSACEGVAAALHSCWCALNVQSKQLLCYPTRLAVVDTIDSLWGVLTEHTDLLSSLDGLTCRRLFFHVFVLAALHAEAAANRDTPHLVK